MSKPPRSLQRRTVLVQHVLVMVFCSSSPDCDAFSNLALEASKNYYFLKFPHMVCQHCIVLLISQSSCHIPLPPHFGSDSTMPLNTHFWKSTAVILKYEAVLMHLLIPDKQHTFPMNLPEVHTYFPLSTHLGYTSCPLLHCTWNKVVPDSSPKWFCLQ